MGEIWRSTVLILVINERIMFWGFYASYGNYYSSVVRYVARCNVLPIHIFMVPALSRLGRLKGVLGASIIYAYFGSRIRVVVDF